MIAKIMTTAPVEQAQPGFRQLLSPPFLGPTLTVSLGIGLHAFNEYSVAPVLPTALADLGALAYLPWSYALFFCGVIAGGMTSSAMRAWLGARTTAMLSALLYTATIVLNSSAQSAEQILAGRAIQGLAEGWLTALCYSLIPEVVTGSLVATLIAFETIVWAGAAILGPTLGGAAADLFGWRIGLAVSSPIVLLFIGASSRFPTNRQPGTLTLGMPQFVTVLFCVCGILFCLLPSAMPGEALTILALPAGAGILFLAMRQDARRAHPLFPVQVFRLKDSVGLGGWVLLLVTAGLSISTVFLAFTVQSIFGVSSSVLGGIVLIMPLAWTLTALPVGKVRNPALLRRLFLLGPCCHVVGALLLIHGLTAAQLGYIIVGQAVIGLGLGAIWGPVMDAMIAAAREEDRSRVGSLLPATTTVGYVLGAGLGGWLAMRFDLMGGDQPPSDRAIQALWGTMILFALLSLAVIRGMRPSVARPERDQPRPE